MGFDHHLHAPYALPQQLVVVVAHLVAQGFVVRGRSVHVLGFLAEKGGDLSEHALSFFFFWSLGQLVGEEHSFRNKALHVIKAVLLISEVALHEGVDELLFSLAEVGVLVGKKGNLLVGIGQSLVTLLITEGMRLV